MTSLIFISIEGICSGKSSGSFERSDQVLAHLQRVTLIGTVSGQWIRLCLPSFGPGLKPKFYSQNLYYNCHCIEKRTKINKKKPGLPIFLKKNFVMSDPMLSQK